ncbi:Dynein heavy chain 5, axonemal [Acipenser ruthenus]|uniref:Dynein heavy chain 5, axonemal n=1 Tax=Acipenser ruthenus TaxID=7906 RepID=A0A444UN44_ACIRT|nr:Dynein heavy chain 5, axonemal [Acipenser ruthenus]
MDERHWWIATKVQETFRVGGNDSLTELEELFLQADNLQLIDTFLKAEGLAKLFFFANTESQEELQPCDLNIGENLDNVIDSRNTAILYFLRHKTDRDVDPIRMEQDIFCGEIKHNLVDSLISQLSEIYIPLFRAQEDWGSCTQDDVRHFLLGLDRYVSALQDSAGAAVRSEKQQILKRPAQIVSSDIMQQRSVPVDSDVVSENEALVSDWMKTIEQVLNEGGDDRVLDINTTPLTELDRWQRRQRSLESITEQLKGKECRNVIGLLISTKSRLLKKWKAVDISENNPVNLMNTVLPGIVNTIKQIDAMSRFFSRNAYLGLLLTKVGNQLTLACREFLKEGLVLGNSEDRLWDRIREEMERGYLLPLQAVSHPKNKGKERKPEQTINTNTLYDRVQACLMLQACFLDTVRQLREALGGSHGLPLFSSSSSLSTMQGKLTSFSTGRVTKASLRKTSLTSSCLDHSHDYQGLGVPLTDEETIMHNLDLLCCKLRQFSNVIVALQQYKTLLDQTRGLQKPSYEDLSVNDLGDGESIHELTVEDHIDSLRAEIKLYSTEPCRTGLSVAPLQTLIEEDEVQSATGLPILALHHQSESKRLVPLEETSDPQQLRSKEEEEEEEEEAVNTLSYEEKLMLRNLYNWNDPEDEGCSLSSIISDYLNNMINTMASAVRTEVLLGVEKRDLDTFEDVYSEFLVMNQQLERYLSIYIQALFLRRMHTQEALSILKRFSVVGQRQGIQPVINECYVETLEWFYEEIKEVQETYEEQKDDPVLPRNLPPAAGAIYWSRQLLSKIEEPMKIFREVRVITTSNSYIQTVRLYNRIAAALVAYETLWYQEWRSQADRCLDGLNATLLIRDPDTQELMVNCDPRIIQLFEETKWMVRFKLQVPQAVMLALKQEKKFKMYKSRLQGILQEYQCVKKTVPECLAVQFAAQLEYVNRHFQPGLSLLAWNSVDIEAFLHHVYKDITRLRAVVEKAAQIKETVIDKALEAIQNLELFNADEVLSESRSPTEFLQLIRSSLQKNQAELEQIVKTIKTAISDLRFSIKNAKDGSLGVSQDSAPLKPLNKHSHSRLRQALSQARQHASLSIAAGGSNSYEESDSQVLEYFCSQTGKAVFACVCRSLLVLAQVTGCDMERIIAEVSLNHQEEVHTGSSATASDTGTNTASEVSSSSIIRSTISEVMMDQKSHLRCSLKLRLTIPTIVIDPTCEVAQDAVNEAASAVLDLTDCVNWGPGETQEGTLISTIREDKTIQHILRHINHVIISLKPTIEKHIFHYSYYDFLWKDDMNCQYTELTSVNCELLVINKVVERIHKIEQKIQDFSPVFQVGCLWLDSSVIRDTLKGFAGVWKFKYSSVLHQDVKKRLDTVVQYRDACYQQLTIQVQSLEQLNKALCLLEEIEDMENKIHGIYQPIESTYTQLRSYHLRIPREEATEVDNLWENWTELIVLAENVKRHLLKDKKDVFEQELDKQVKSFGVDVIQFRNSFDTQGPAAPGLKPEEAVHQLQEFQEKFKVYDAKKKTLNSLQRLFGITPKAFLELDRTGKFAVYLREVMESLNAHKVREVTDFEWRRALRFYWHETDGSNSHNLCIHDAQYESGHEFYGAAVPVTMNPITEKSFLSLSHSPRSCNLFDFKQGFAHLLGKFLLLFNCSSYTDPATITAVQHGAARDGCWVGFDDFHLLTKQSVSTFMFGAQTLYDNLKAKLNTCILGDGKEITLNRNVALLLTVHCKSEYKKLPSDVLALFRTVSLTAPDHNVILRANLTAFGFKSPKMLAHRLQLVTELVKDQLPEKVHHHLSLSSLVPVLKRAAQKKEAGREERADGRHDRLEIRNEGERTSRSSSITSTQPFSGSAMSLSPSLKTVPSTDRKTRAVSNNAMTTAARLDHALVGETLLECIAPRMEGDDLSVFNQIVRDIFGVLLDLSSPNGYLQSPQNCIDNAILTSAKDKNLIPHAPWVNKVKQLYSLSQVHHGIIVAGPPGAGKSSCISTLVQALSLLPAGRQQQQAGSPVVMRNDPIRHRLVKFNPLAVDEFTLLFGSQLPSQNWEDGIITSAWRKAIRVLQLSNGEHLKITSNMQLLFETSELELASPASISRAGILYIDSKITGWRPLAKAWLAGRNEQENIVLSKAFNTALDPVFNYILRDIKSPVPLTEVGLFQTITNLLGAMLHEKAQSLGGPLHIERLFLFCLIWTVGGLLGRSDKKRFSDILKSHTSTLPDYDDEVSVFNYYVDESGEWDLWQSRISEHNRTRQTDILGEVFVETVDTLAVRTFMEYADMASQNVLLVGSPGSGKTALINDFIYAQDKSHTLVKRMVFSGASKAKNLQKMFEESTIHRQGFVYGAREGKTLQIFIDDISLPESQCCGELLRQVLDDKVLVKHSKPFEWRQIEALVVQAAMSLPEYPSDSTHSISQRLLRHFAVLNLPFPEGSKLSQVIFSILQANMMKNDGQQLEGNLHNVLVSASCSILESIKRSLRPSADQGRQHYLFSLREIARVFQCLCNLSYERREDTFMVLCFWKHEMRHVVGDRLCQYADLNWFHDQLENIIEQHVPGSHHDSSHEHIVTFPIDEKITKQQSAWNSDKGVQVQLQTVRGIDAVHGCLQAYLKQYNGELGNQPLDIKLSENTLTHVVRIHRVLAYRHSGNLVIVNSPGSHLRTLLKLALYIADIPLQRVDTSQKAHFFNSLKSAVRHAATDRKVAALLLTARELGDDSYLDAINSILISGEYAPLFSREEMHDLLQIINPALQKEHPHLAHDPVSYIASRVKSSLRVIVCLPPNHVLLKTDSVKYPGFLSCCHIIWICDWTQEAVFHETAHYLSECNILEKHSEEIRKQVAGTMASIHCQMLKECQQVPWAGSCDPTLTLNTVTLQKTENDGKETVRTEPVTVPNMPYSKAIVKERIELMDNNGLAPAVYSKVFCGQSTLRQYLDTFKHIYICKCTEQEKTEALLGKSLETLAQTRADARTTQDSIRNLTEQFEEAKTTASDLLERLTSRTSALESLKGQLGIGAASLQAFLAQIESESEEIELDALLKDDDYDEYDKAFYEMKELRSKSHVNKLTEDLEKAKNELEEARNSLSHAKNQVMHWCNKVDKSCIERISRCQNPPFLLAQVLEMVLVMMDLIPNPSDTDLETSRTNRHSNDLSEGRHYQKSVTSRSARNSKMWSTRGGTGKDGKDKVDKTWWKTLQNYVGDIGKFVDMIHNVARLEDGLPGEVLKLVESYLGKTKEGSLGVTGEGSLLENAAPHATPQSITPAKKFTVVDSSVRKGGITIAAARYCSEEAATLVAFVVALVEYTRLCGPLRACLSRVQELEVEKEDNEWKDQEIQKVGAFLCNISHNVKVNCQLVHVMLFILHVHSQSGESEEKDLLDTEPEKPVFTADELPILQSEVQQLQSEYDVAVANKHKIETELHSNKERLRAAQDVLKRLMGCELFLLKCEEGGLPLPQKVLFRQMTLMQFMHNPIEIQKLQMKGPALNKNTQTISCIFKRKGCIGTWVLLCDPTAQSIEWVKNHFLPDCMEVKYHELQSQLDCCLTEGIPLLLTYCDLQSLTTDQRFAQVLRSQLEFERNTSPFKITVADHEVECHPGFRLVLHTPGLPEEVPPEVAAFCSTAYFYQDREGLAEQLLDRFVQLEKTRLGEEYTTLQQECLENMEDLRDVEMKIAQTLSSDCTLLSSLAINKKLSDLKQHYDEARETRARLSLSEKTALTAREGFRDIALRGGIMFDTANALRQLNSTYHISYNQLLEVFDASVAHSERHTIKAIVDRLTYNIFCYVGTYLLERDRMVYSLLLAFEIEGCLGRIDPGEMEFILSPELCAVVMQGMGAEGSGARHHSKNPFDWMTEDQFKNVQILAMYYSWFWDLFDRMYKDGKEMTWKALCDSDQPETPTKGKCPEGLDELSPLQRLLVVRAVRSDRLTHAASIFISSALGKRYTAEIPFDLQNCLQQSKPQSLILLQFSAEGDAPRRLVLELAHRRSCRTQVLSVINCSVNEGRRIKHLIEQGMAEGNWVLLENIHNSAHLMTSLEGILNVNKSPDRNFRLWVSASTSSNLPVRLLHISHRIIVDQPKNMKDGMLRCLQGVDSEALKTSSRPEWPAVVHNLCFLHSAVRLRAASGGAMGWNSRDTMMFGNQQFMDALQVLTEEFRDRDPEAEGRGVSWTGIRYLLSEVIYGSNIIDESDRISLASLVDLWISSTATKKDCDLTKLKYRVPAAFFIPGTQLSSLLQALDSVPRNSLDVPEAVSMHSASEISLNYLDSPSNTAININLPLVATQGNHSLIQLKPSKEPELWEICYNILAKLPKGWTKAIKSSTESLSMFGGRLSEMELCVARDLYQQRAPQHWSCLAGRAFPLTQGHTAWISDLQLRVSHFEKILLLGQEKMPTYWLGAFRNPKGLLGVFRQQSAKQHAERTGSIEPMVFQTVITQRDKEHMRDPPQEGMFVYGIYLWGVSWHKTEAELLDAPPRRGPVPLPVIHLHCMPRAEKASLAEAIRTTDTYQCPVYTSSKGPREPVLHLDIHKESVPATRWALRGMKATLQPF